MRTCSSCSARFDDDSRFCPDDGTLLTRPSEPRPGEVLPGGLRILAPLGRGAMGAVFRAADESLGRTVAVKVLRDDLANDGVARARLLREAQAAARLPADAAVVIHWVGESDEGLPFLVMEELRGRSLEDLLAAGPIPITRAVTLARRIALALAASHAAGVVHRDLKPSNIVVLDGASDPDRIKLIDFGLAQVDQADPGDRVTRAGAVLGTPSYLSPEQAQGLPVSAAADLYSLGVVLYRMLSGRLPFEGSAVQVLMGHMTGEPPGLGDAGIPRALDALVGRCLRKAPTARPESAAELAAELARLGDELRPAAAPGGSRSGRRRLPVVLGLALALTAVGLGLGPAASRSRPAAAAALPLGVGSAPAPVAPTRLTAPPPPAPAELAPAPATRAVMLSQGGYALRLRRPAVLAVGRPAELVIDVWDEHGEPLARPSFAIAIESPGGRARAAEARLAPLAGRYVVAIDWPVPGTYRLHLELSPGTVVHVHLDVAE